MDLVPTPDQGSTGDDGLSGWLAEVEGRLTAIDARLAALESSFRPAVAEEVQGATADLRRAMTELGRRLVQDLPHELARHRDAIVAELRPPAPAPAPADDIDIDTDTDDTELAVATVPAAEPDPDGADVPEADDDRRPVRRRRRRG